MSEFQKFVSYINLYQNQQKIRNVGFARIEKKKSQCTLQLQLKNCNFTNISFPVYLLRMCKDMIEEIEIGKITFLKGNATAQFFIQEQDFIHYSSHFQWKELCGFLIQPSENIYLISQWNDDELLGKKFVKAQKRTEISTEKVEESISPKEDTKITPSPEDVIFNEKNDIFTTKEISSNTETSPSLTEDVILTTETDSPKNREEIYELFMEHYPKMTPFQGNQEIDCVRIELKDLRKLPPNYWYLGNNSFLLHGFFNYRYLILGSLTQENQKHYFLGIPGIFQPQEKVMATFFGFPEFLYENSKFGYWYRFFES